MEILTLFFLLFLQISFLVILTCSFFRVFIPGKLKNISLHLLVYSEADIDNCSVKQLLGKI